LSVFLFFFSFFFFFFRFGNFEDGLIEILDTR
jgi:hypothetical protein